MTNELFGSVDDYINGLLVPDDDALTAAERAIVESGMPQIIVSKNQGKFLQVLTKLCGAKKILEVGTLGGYSTIWMARGMAPGGKIITLEIDPKHADVARKNFERAGLANVIDIRLGKAIDLMPKLRADEEGPFDLIFIDADKPGYSRYLDLSIKLARSGTVILADNLIRDGAVMDATVEDENARAAREFNAKLAAHPQLESIIIPFVKARVDGMSISIVK